MFGKRADGQRDLKMSIYQHVGDTVSPAPFKKDYLESLALIERLHRLLLDVIKDEFERLGVLEINAVQALLLFNIGDHEVTAGELKSRGYYQGSNVSYNLKKFVNKEKIGEGTNPDAVKGRDPFFRVPTVHLSNSSNDFLLSTRSPGSRLPSKNYLSRFS